MTPDEFAEWLEGLYTPCTLTDELKEEIIDNYNSTLQ